MGDGHFQKPPLRECLDNFWLSSSPGPGRLYVYVAIRR
jgi:hypothetical protein